MFFDLEINGDAKPKVSRLIETLEDGRPLFQRISQVLEAETESNFAAQGRPGPPGLGSALQGHHRRAPEAQQRQQYASYPAR